MTLMHSVSAVRHRSQRGTQSSETIFDSYENRKQAFMMEGTPKYNEYLSI
jgi:hypothetical protein